MSSQLLPNPSPEAELLLCCIRPRPFQAIVERVRSLLQGDIDWNSLLRLAEKHRVVPFLYHGLKGVCLEAVPIEIASTLRTRFLENARKNLILTTELLRLLEIFKTEEIAIIPYKGTVLSASIYGKTAFRQVWDIDFLVDEKDFPASRSLLLSEGYTLKEANDREESFFHSDKKIEVDLHWGLTPFYFPVELNFPRLLARTKSYPLAGGEVKSFGEEDLLIVLCLQIAKDCWERRLHIEHLAKVRDIAGLVNHYPRLNWSETLARSRELGLERVLHFGLYLAIDLFAAEVPDEIRAEVSEDPIALSLARQVCERLFGEIDSAIVAPRGNSLFDFRFRFRQMLFYLKMRERPRDRLQHFAEIGGNGLRLLQSRGILPNISLVHGRFFVNFGNYG